MVKTAEKHAADLTGCQRPKRDRNRGLRHCAWSFEKQIAALKEELHAQNHSRKGNRLVQARCGCRL